MQMYSLLEGNDIFIVFDSFKVTPSQKNYQNGTESKSPESWAARRLTMTSKIMDAFLFWHHDQNENKKNWMAD